MINYPQINDDSFVCVCVGTAASAAAGYTGKVIYAIYKGYFLFFFKSSSALWYK